jgi:hypothetical protein
MLGYPYNYQAVNQPVKTGILKNGQPIAVTEAFDGDVQKILLVRAQALQEATGHIESKDHTITFDGTTYGFDHLDPLTKNVAFSQRLAPFPADGFYISSDADPEFYAAVIDGQVTQFTDVLDSTLLALVIEAGEGVERQIASAVEAGELVLDTSIPADGRYVSASRIGPSRDYFLSVKGGEVVNSHWGEVSGDRRRTATIALKVLLRKKEAVLVQTNTEEHYPTGAEGSDLGVVGSFCGR